STLFPYTTLFRSPAHLKASRRVRTSPHLQAKTFCGAGGILVLKIAGIRQVPHLRFQDKPQRSQKAAPGSQKNSCHLRPPSADLHNTACVLHALYPSLLSERHNPMLKLCKPQALAAAVAMSLGEIGRASCRERV